MVLIFGVCAIVGLSILVNLSSARSPSMFALGLCLIVLVPCASFGIWRAVLFSRLRRLLNTGPPKRLRAILGGDQFAKSSLSDLTASPIRLGRCLLAFGHAGCVIRFHSLAYTPFAPLQPLRVPLEPVLLSEADSHLKAVAASMEDERTPESGEWVAARQAIAGSSGAGWRIFKTRWVPIVTPLVLVGAYVVAGFSFNWSGVGDWRMWLPNSGFFLIVALMTWRRLAVPCAWIAPGVLIVRPAWPQRRLRIFRRESSLLIHEWPYKSLYAAAKRHAFVLTLTEQERDLALRIWLSPAPSPTDEQLAALFGETIQSQPGNHRVDGEDL